VVKPAKARAKEHVVVVNNVRRVMLEARSADACSHGWRNVRAPRAHNRRMGSVRSKCMRPTNVSAAAKVAASPSAEMATATEAAPAHVAASATTVAAAAVLRPRNRGVNPGGGEHTNSNNNVSEDRTAKEARHKTTLLAATRVEATRIARTRCRQL
jgi:hypothetical protein